MSSNQSKPAPPEVHQILIVLRDGNLSVQAPPDKVLTLGMMEMAKVVIANQKQGGNVLIPRGGISG